MTYSVVGIQADYQREKLIIPFSKSNALLKMQNLQFVHRIEDLQSGYFPFNDVNDSHAVKAVIESKQVVWK